MSQSLLNQTHVRKYTLNMLQAKRPHLAEKMTRISQSYFDRIEAKLKNIIINELETLSSTGKTIN